MKKENIVKQNRLFFPMQKHFGGQHKGDHLRQCFCRTLGLDTNMRTVITGINNTKTFLLWKTVASDNTKPMIGLAAVEV